MAVQELYAPLFLANSIQMFTLLHLYLTQMVSCLYVSFLIRLQQSEYQIDCIIAAKHLTS